jgi:hypothetical protein
MLVGAVVGGAASALSLLNHYRQQLGPMSVREARLLARMEPTPIAHARTGLVKLVGRVGAAATVQSYYHRVDCVALELHHYDVVDSASGPRRVLVRKEVDARPFWIEDDSVRLALDPTKIRIDYEVEGSDLDSTIEEHRIRVGEQVAILGVVRRAGPQLSQPMRRASTNFDEGVELAPDALLTWRTEPEVYPRLGPPTGGMAHGAGSIGMAVLGSLLNR